MKKLTRDTAIAALVFFVVNLLLQGGDLSGEAIWTAIFASIVFAMMFAAIGVAIIIFKGDKE